MQEGTPYVKQQVQEGIATIEFFTPHHNSMPGAILKQLAQAIIAQGQDPQVKVIVLQSAGDRTFVLAQIFRN